MIKQQFHLRMYDWVVTFYYNVTAQHFYEVMFHLKAVGCEGNNFITAWNNINKGCCNRGLTFSDYEGRQSIVVVGEASTFGELMNSLSHEIHHLSVHIAQSNGLDLAGEEVCYIDGEVTQRVFELFIGDKACNMQSTSSVSCPLSSGSCKYGRVNKECSRSFP
mgnify:CR=1 FL=1